MDKQSSPDIEQQLRNRAGQMPRPFGYSPELQMLVDAANEIARLRASLRSPDGTATTRMPEGLADFARRCRAYLDDCPGDGGHSDAAGSTAYELIEEAIEHCTLPPSIAAAQPSLVPYDKMAIEMELFFGLTHFMHD